MSSDNIVPFPGADPARSTSPVPDPGAADTLDIEGSLPQLVEALLFAAGEPITLRELVIAIGDVEPDLVRDTLHELAQASVGRGVRLVRIAGGWQFRTDPRFADPILRLRGGRPQKMSKAALEALAVVAYQQPVTRSEIENVRGVSSGGVVKTLLEKGYLRVTGRRAEPGRPLEYATTEAFLEMFSLAGLESLPTMKERAELNEGEDTDA